MADTRFSISKRFGTSEVTFFGGDANHFSIPVNGIPGLAGYGFVSLLEAQTTGGPKTPEYVANVAADLSVYLSTAWKPGDSAGIMRRKFQLTRALVIAANRKNKKVTLTFADVLVKVMAVSDAERQAEWLKPYIRAEVSKWNVKGATRSVERPEAFKSIVG